MILDVQQFISREKSVWDELDALLNTLEDRAEHRLSLDEAKRLHYLYQRTSADLSKMTTFAAEPRTKLFLEALVSRAYGEIHETRRRPYRISPTEWFFKTFPQTFRRHRWAFSLALTITMVGALFGAIALTIDGEAKAVILPFPHLQGDPSDRVAYEESAKEDRLENAKGAFSTMLMTHNTKVAILTMATGMTWGFGTLVLLFYNGVILGAVTWDYILAGEIKFLFGWLLPHGSIEIPAILIGGQAGFVLARALIGWNSSLALRARMREVTSPIITLIAGTGLLLIWAGIVESFFSQYHEPFIPYTLKIVFGAAQLILLYLFLSRSGLKAERQQQTSRDAKG